MKHKNIKPLILSIFLILLTGCVKYSVNMGINPNKAIELKIITSIQKEYYQLDENNDLKEYEDLGYIVEKYDDGNYKGLMLTKTFDNIDSISAEDVDVFELNDLLEKNTNDLKIFKIARDNEVSTYTANFTYDLQIIDEQTNYNSNIASMSNKSNDFQSSIMSFTYSISFPRTVKIISHNATSTGNNGYTLNWNINYGQVNNINFVFAIDGNATEDENDDYKNNDVIVDGATEDKSDLLQDATITSNNNYPAKISYISYVITGLIFLIIVLGFVVLKIKLSKKNMVTNNSQIYHNQPPKGKDM